MPFVSSTAGIGNGEEKLLVEPQWSALSPRHMRGSKTFDIELCDGTRWEVKMPSDRSAVRSGVSGYRSSSTMLSKFISVGETISSFYQLCGQREAEFFSSRGLTRFYIESYISETHMPILDGSLTVSRAIDSHNSVMSMCKRVHDVTLRISQSDARLRERTLSLSRSLFSRSCVTRFMDDDAWLSTWRDIERSSAVELALATLSHELFDSPYMVEQLWESSTTPSRVFSHVDGVVLVDARLGWCVISRDEFDDVFDSRGISQGRPHFNVVQLKA